MSVKPPRVQNIFQTSDHSAAARIATILKELNPFSLFVLPQIGTRARPVVFNGASRKRFEAKYVRNHPELDDNKILTHHARKLSSMENHNQTQTKPATQPSTSSPASERETLDQQSGSRNPAFFAGTTAYTQHGVGETFDPESPRPSPDKSSAYKSTIEQHDLPGASSQTLDSGSIQHEPRTPRLEEAYLCPFHGPILQDRPTQQSGQGMGPMDRYLAEDSSERYTILPRPDTGSLATCNGCRCLEMMQSGIHSNGPGQ